MCPPSALALRPAQGVGPGLSISVSHDAPDWGVEHGTEVNYEFTLINTGDVTITDVVVVDTLCGEIGNLDSMAPGGEVEFDASAVITGTGVGTVTALGRGPDGGIVTASAGHSVEVFIGHEWLDYAVSIRASNAVAGPGDEVELVVSVENLSDEPGGDGDVELKVLFDSTSAALVDAQGADVRGATLVWSVDGPGPGASGVERSLRLRIDEAAVSGSSVRVDAVILVDESRTDIDPSNDQASLAITVGSADSASSTSASAPSLTGSPEPFLPFTGGSPAGFGLALALGVLGAVLRRTGT